MYVCVLTNKNEEENNKKKRILKQSKKKKERNYYILKSNTFYVSIQYPLPCGIGFLRKWFNAKIENMNPVNRYYVNHDNDVHSACLKINLVLP